MTKYGTAALALAGVLALSVTSASAQWRGHHRGPHWGGVAAGVAAGALIGSAVASRPYGYSYGPRYYEEPGYYVEAPVAGYSYGAPSYGYYGNESDCSSAHRPNRDCAAGDTGR